MVSTNGHTRFFEVQYFWQNRLSWIVWLVCIPTVWLLYRDDAIHGLFAFVLILLMIGLIALVMLSKLTTEVSASGISFRMTPFHRTSRTYAWSDIDSVEIRKYSPIREYGGWGIRMGLQGTAYNIKGNIGLQIVTQEGKRILIGTQKPEELNEVLDHLGKLTPAAS